MFGLEGGLLVSRNRRAERPWAWLVAAVVALGTIGVVLAQPPDKGAATTPAGPGKSARGSGLGKVPSRKVIPKKAQPNAADPLAKPANDPNAAKPAAPGTYHFRLKIHSFDDAPLAAAYFPPAKADTTTPVVLLVHEKDRSYKDFEDPIPELKGQGLAAYLQEQGYAVLAFDLRGHGTNARRAMSERDWAAMVPDLQAIYQFLLDRHNRGELNLSKLGVVALAEGANLAASWAYEPYGGVSSEGRVTDLSGLVLISPLAEGEGHAFTKVSSALAPRIAILLMAGERDVPAHETVKRARGAVEKVRQNKVELFPSSLHGYQLLRLEPRATAVITKFLEGTVKLKSTDWEPRYNLTPVSYTDINVVTHVKPGEAKEKAKEKEKEAPKGKPDEAEKAADKEKAKEKEAPKAEAK